MVVPAPTASRTLHLALFGRDDLDAHNRTMELVDDWDRLAKTRCKTTCTLASVMVITALNKLAETLAITGLQAIEMVKCMPWI